MDELTRSVDEMRPNFGVFAEMEGFVKGFPGADLPYCAQLLYSVIGFPPPSLTPASDDVPWQGPGSPIPADGFSLGYGYIKPGNGNILHNHDTNETFIFVTGRWRVYWNADESAHMDFGPMDAISIPAGLPRRYVNLSSTSEDPNEASLLIAVVDGNTPVTITEPHVLQEAATSGRYTAAWDMLHSTATSQPA